MDLLEKKILEEGQLLEGNILKVDGFLNHQVDPELTLEMAKDFYAHFQDQHPNKVLTLEVSGIPAALLTAHLFQVPMVFAKKIASRTLSDDVYVSEVFSYTKEIRYEIRVDRRFLKKEDRVLLVDDFLAKGQALSGLLDLCNQAQAQVVGIGILIEKAFQGGGERFRQAGYDLYSLAKIAKFEDGKVVFE